ncbi:MAG TPA: OmpA family protein [Kofleriaceae bacterium]|nr:OmpA family protein [Kofleriaceae bacterium]
MYGTAAVLLFAAPALAQAPDSDTELQGSASVATPGIRMSVKLEPALAVALSNPQSKMTEAGGGQTIKLLFGLTRYLEAGPSAAVVALPSERSMTDSGTSWAFGATARLMRPHDAAPERRGIYAASPWIDGDAVYVRTGGLDRPGFAAAAGLAIPIDQRRRFWVGPFVRYFQIVQGERAGFDNRDAKILSAGISFEVSTGLERMRAPAPIAEPVIAAPVAEPTQVSDRDGDGVVDSADHCPDVAGPADKAGCPLYDKVVVQRDKLELKEKIAFRWDSAKLDDASLPALDDVVRALRDNPGFRVQVDGHASSDGSDAYNQTLSEQRADAVLGYLVAHGVASERVVAKGFSSSMPIDTNRTPAGRELNRRVEFVVDFIILEGKTP